MFLKGLMEKATTSPYFAPSTIITLVAILVGGLWGVGHIFRAFNGIFGRIYGYIYPYSHIHFPETEANGRFWGVGKYWATLTDHHLKFWERYVLRISSYGDKNQILVLDKGILKDAHEKRTLVPKNAHKLYVNHKTEGGHAWESRIFQHPASFRTISMEDKEKSMLQTELEHFLKAENYYTNLGKIWKKKLFIYGPSGTGKSTLISCIANLSKLDTYSFTPEEMRKGDMEELIKDVQSRCIVVFEEFGDFFRINENARKEDRKPSLAEFLNFIETCWCSSGGPKIIIFTSTNDYSYLMKEHVDSMIKLGLCSFEQFKFLARLFQELPESFEEFGKIECMLKHTQLPPSIICRFLKKIPTDTSPDRFVDRIINALEKLSSIE